MTPYELVKEHYQLPIELYDFQKEATNGLAPLTRAGYYLDVGCGKTFTSIVSALYKLITGQVTRIICIMPPVLITNWSRTLARIPGVTVTEYRGSPAQRTKLNLDVQFVLMSYQIFCGDWDYLYETYINETTCVLADEATAMKNIATRNYKRIRDFTVTNHIMLLTGTPMSTPVDGYAYVKTISPGVYRNLLQFENIHVAKRDFFKKPTEWANLDLLKENLALNSARVLKEDVLKDLPPITYTEMYYDMQPKHLRLYQQLAEEQLKVLESGDKIDLTNTTALFHALQQIPANAEYFSGGEIESTIYELIHEIMEELGDKKLVIFTKYKLTNKKLESECEKYRVRCLYGDVSAKQKQANLDTFTDDLLCRLLVLQLRSGGFGIDNLQHVCTDMLFLELPHTSADFTQAVALFTATARSCR